MAEGWSSPFELEKALSPELEKAVAKIPQKNFDNKVPSPTLDDNRKRWLIVGICLHDIVSPTLRTYIEPIVRRLYNSLKLSDQIDIINVKLQPQKTFNHKLDYKSINNNNIHRHIHQYDFRIQSHVDLSKTFLPYHMAQYTGFDSSCDSSALLGIMVNICDQSYFPVNVQSDAKQVRQDIRNSWAHCDFKEWDCTKYSSSFNLLETFIKKLSLKVEDETRILRELKKWETCGMQFVDGSTLGLELVQDIYHHVKALAEYVKAFAKETNMAFKKVSVNNQPMIYHLECRITNLEKKMDTTTYQVAQNTRSVKRHQIQMDTTTYQVAQNTRSVKRHQIQMDTTTYQVAQNTSGIKRHQIQIDETYRNVKRLKSDKTKKSQTDPVPWNIRVLIQSTLETWKKTDGKFVTTRASAHVLKCIKTKSCVTVTGSSGVGKTATVRHVALLMAEEGYDILPVTDPSDIYKFYNPNKKTLYVVDDLCGKYTLNQNSFDKWSEQLPFIDPLLEHIKIIISCRLQVYKDEKIEDVELFKSCECNLLSKQLCLLETEKDSIAKMYLKTNASKVKQYSDKFDFFPLLCHLCNENPKLDVVDFFQNPFSVYESELDKLRIGDYTKYCSLALCVIFNNRLKEEWLTEEVDTSIDVVIQNTCEVCKLNRETSKILLKDELNSLLGTFLNKEENVYSTLHDKLFDFLSHYFGEKMITCLIKNANCWFIRERFLFERQVDSDQYITIVPKKNQEMYIKRMIDDWTKGNVTSVFCNINMKVPNFRKMFLSYINKLDISYQRQLAYTVDSMFTVLILCCVIGDIDFIQWCLSHNVDINQHRYDGGTPLLTASQEGHTDIVKILLSNKADINKCSDDGASPLIMACQHGHVEIVKLLLTNNADINKCSSEGVSPLYMACIKGDVEIFKLLLTNRADINKCSNNEVSSLHVACGKGHIEIVNILLSNKADINKCSSAGVSPLYMACIEGDVEIVNILLSNKADVNKCSSAGASPLYAACVEGHIEIVNTLLTYKADINKSRNDGVSPLFVACGDGHVKIVKLLLTNNADINKCTNDGISPLCVACESGHKEIVEILLSNKADINTCDSAGISPLLIVCWYGHIEIVKILLSNKADITNQAVDGTTPLFWAQINGHTEIVKMLQQYIQT